MDTSLTTSSSSSENMDTSLTTSSSSSETTPLLEHTSSYQKRRTSRFTQTKTFSRAVICIRFVTFCSRLNFFSIFFGLAFFATGKDFLGFNSAVTWTSMFIFHGTMCVVSVLGGWLADSKLGKSSVILYGMFTCLFGTILLLITIIKLDSLKKEWAVTVYIIGLIFVAFGQGGIFGNDILFAAEQVPNNGPTTIQSHYYWWHYLENISEFLVLTFLVYIEGKPSAYLYVHLVSVCSLVLGLIVFLAGKLNRIYIIYPPYGSVVLETLQVAKEAMKKSRRPSNSRSFLDHWLDRAKTCFGGSFSSWEVDDVKKIYRLLPILATLIFYYIVYYQIMVMLFRDILVVFFFLAVLILVPFMNKVVYPLLAKFDICPSQLQRIGIGMMFTVASMAWAGGIKLYRVDCGEQNLMLVSDIPYCVPQYVLAGFGRILTNFTAFEFVITETPTYLQGVVMGLVWYTMGLGSYVSGVLVLIKHEVKKWYNVDDQINNHYLAYTFFALAGLMFLVSFLFIYVARNFKAKKESAERANLNINEETSTSFHYARNSSC